MSASRPTAHFSWDAVVAYETLAKVKRYILDDRFHETAHMHCAL
jgi:hypothetical protein